MARLQIFYDINLYDMIHVLISIIIHKMSFGPRICLILVRIIKYSSIKTLIVWSCLDLLPLMCCFARHRRCFPALTKRRYKVWLSFLDDEHRSVNSKMAKWGKVSIPLLVINRQPRLMKMMNDVYETSVKQNGLLLVSAVKPRNAQLLQAYFPQRRRTTLWGWFCGQSIEMWWGWFLVLHFFWPTLNCFYSIFCFL